MGNKASATSNFVAITVNYDKNLTLNANLDCRSSRVNAPFLDSLICVQAYLKVDGNGSIAGTFSAQAETRNAVFSVYSPGVLELNGIIVMGAQKENDLSNPTFARAVYVNSGTAVFNAGSFKGVGYANDHSTWGQSPTSGVIVQSGAHVIVNGGTFQSAKAKENYGILTEKSADVILAGGTFYGICSSSNSKMLSTLLKSKFVYKKVSDGSIFNGSSTNKTEETLRVDYTGSGLRPTEQLSNTQIPMTVGYEFLQFTSPDDNTWYNDSLAYSIEGNSARLFRQLLLSGLRGH